LKVVREEYSEPIDDVSTSPSPRKKFSLSYSCMLD
jgi:hypothetical protein